MLSATSLMASARKQQEAGLLKLLELQAAAASTEFFEKLQGSQAARVFLLSHFDLYCIWLLGAIPQCYKCKVLSDASFGS